MNKNIAFEKYKLNFETAQKYGDRMVTSEIQANWDELFETQLAGTIELFNENNKIIEDVQKLMAEPLTLEIADYLYDNVIDFYNNKIDDAQFIIEIIDHIIPFYLQDEDQYFEKLILLFNAYTFEISEILYRKMNWINLELSYAEKNISYFDKYDFKIEDSFIRQKIWIAFYNKMVVGLDRGFFSPREAISIYDDMMEKWKRPEIQLLDGNNQEIKEIIKISKVVFTNLVEFIDSEDQEVVNRFCKEVNTIVEDNQKEINSEYELNPITYAAYIYTDYLKGECDLDSIFDKYLDYYRYQEIQLDTKKAVDYETVRIYYDMTSMLLKWAEQGVSDEKLRRMNANFMTLAEKNWKIESVYINMLMSELLIRVCKCMVSFENMDIEVERCINELMIKRNMISSVHSSVVSKLAVTIFEQAYEQNPFLFFQYTDMGYEKLRDFVEKNGIFHDISASFVLYAMATSNRPLYEKEIQLMELHCQTGADFVESVSKLNQYKDVILGHHKSYDGKTGYPKDYDNTTAQHRIITDLIHLVIIIETSTDIYLTKGNQISFEQLWVYLEQCKGTECNPDLVDIILQNEDLKAQIIDIMTNQRNQFVYDYYHDKQAVIIHKNADELIRDINELLIEISNSKDYDAFTPQINRLFEMAAREHSDYHMGIAYMYTARYHDILKDYHSAINACFESLKYLERCDAKKDILYVLNMIGAMFSLQGNYESGLTYFLQAIHIGKKEGEIGLITKAYNNVGTIFMMSKDYKKAIEYYKKAEEYETNDEVLLIYLMNMLHCYVKLDQEELVRENYDRIRLLADMTDFPIGVISVSLMNAADYLKDYKEAENYYQTAKKEAIIFDNILEYLDEIRICMDYLERHERFDELADILDKIIDLIHDKQVSMIISLSFLEQRLNLACRRKEIDVFYKLSNDIVTLNQKQTENRSQFFKQLEANFEKNQTIHDNAVKMLEENKALELEVQQAQKASAAKTAFLSNMSHEIRTPIHAVLGLDEMILRESTEPQIIEYAQDIETAGKTLLGIINDVLDFSKMEAGKLDIIPEKYELRDVIRDLRNMVEQRAKDKNLGFFIHLDENTPKTFYGDDLRIKQVVLNILTNAVKYTERGQIDFTISTKKIDEESVHLCFSVKDTGMGMKPEEMEKLTAPFERLDEKKNRNIEGTGLGMSIVSLLTKQMNGVLTVESEYEKGSLFTIEIPQVVFDWNSIGSIDDKKKDVTRTETLFTAPEAEILLVDDNMVNLKVCTSLLKRTKVRVTQANSGYECLEIAKQKKFHVILLDHRMPKMDGVETLKLLKSDVDLNKHTPVIALTANAVSGALDYYKSEGFDDLLTKPVNVVELEKKLRYYLPSNLLIDN